MKTCCHLLLIGIIAVLVVSCSKPEPRPAIPPDEYMASIQLVEGSRIFSKDDAGTTSIFTIEQVSLVKDSGSTVQYKIGYSKSFGAPGTEMRFSVFGSMWLDLVPSFGKWTCGSAMYAKEAVFNRNQIERPSNSNLISENEAQGRLTRETLKRAGIYL